MLRITQVQQDGRTVTLKLEGKIHAEWVVLLQEECAHLLRQYESVNLDFSGVSYLDAHGIKLVRSWSNGEIRITRCPQFIADLLDEGGCEH